MRIYLLDGGQESYVAPFFFEYGKVGRFGARIVLKVVGVVELCRVDEYADHCGGVFLLATFYERGVSRMKCAHGGYKPDVATVATCGDRAFKPGYSSANLHFQKLVYPDIVYLKPTILSGISGVVHFFGGKVIELNG